MRSGTAGRETPNPLHAPVQADANARGTQNRETIDARLVSSDRSRQTWRPDRPLVHPSGWSTERDERRPRRRLSRTWLGPRRDPDASRRGHDRTGSQRHRRRPVAEQLLIACSATATAPRAVLPRPGAKPDARSPPRGLSSGARPLHRGDGRCRLRTRSRRDGGVMVQPSGFSTATLRAVAAVFCARSTASGGETPAGPRRPSPTLGV